MKKPAHVFRASAALALLGLGLGIACSDQAEGDRCEIENGDADCGAGLICVPGRKTLPSASGGSWKAEYATGLNEAFLATDPNDTSKDRCCPAVRDQASHPACVRQTAAGTAPPPADSGPEASTVTPATEDAASSADAGSVTDASQDAPDAD